MPAPNNKYKSKKARLEEYYKNPNVQAYLAGIRFTETGNTELNWNAKNPKSTARGPYQFLDSSQKDILNNWGVNAYSKDPKEVHLAALGLMAYKPQGLESIKKGDFKKADTMYNKYWTSLPGGAEPNVHTPKLKDVRAKELIRLTKPVAPKPIPAPEPGYFEKFMTGYNAPFNDSKTDYNFPTRFIGGLQEVFGVDTNQPTQKQKHGGRLTKEGKKIRKYGPRPDYMNQNPSGMTTGPITQRSIGNTPGGGYMSFGDGGWVYPTNTGYPKYADGGATRIYTNPAEFKRASQAYRDSSELYNFYNNLNKRIERSGLYLPNPEYYTAVIHPTTSGYRESVFPEYVGNPNNYSTWTLSTTFPQKTKFPYKKGISPLKEVEYTSKTSPIKSNAEYEEVRKNLNSSQPFPEHLYYSSQIYKKPVVKPVYQEPAPTYNITHSPVPYGPPNMEIPPQEETIMMPNGIKIPRAEFENRYGTNVTRREFEKKADGGWTGYPDHTMYSSAMEQFDDVRRLTKYADGGKTSKAQQEYIKNLGRHAATGSVTPLYGAKDPIFTTIGGAAGRIIPRVLSLIPSFTKPVTVQPKELKEIPRTSHEPPPHKGFELSSEDLEPYISRTRRPATREEEVFESFLSPKRRAELDEERTTYYDNKGNIIPKPKKAKGGPVTWSVVEDRPMAQDGGWLDKIYSALNPYNWGVNDYTDKGDFKTAYAAAKKAGEKEFMWNGERKRVNDKNLPGDRITHRDDFTGNFFSSGASGGRRADTYGDNAMGDAYRYYGGLPLKSNELGISKYIPTSSKNPNARYVSINNEQFLKDMLVYGEIAFNDVKRKEFNDKKFKEYNKVRKIPSENYNKVVPFKYVYDKKGNLIKDTYSFPTGSGTTGDKNSSRALGNMFISKGKDDKGDYYSYYDVFNKDTGKVTDETGHGWATSPYEIYDRIYIRDYGDGQKKKMYYSDKELLQLDPNKKNFDTLALQRELSNRGYELPKSTTEEGTLDGILGKETIDALKDWQSKQNTATQQKKQGGPVTWSVVEDIPMAGDGLIVPPAGIFDAGVQRSDNIRTNVSQSVQNTVAAKQFQSDLKNPRVTEEQFKSRHGISREQYRNRPSAFDVGMNQIYQGAKEPFKFIGADPDLIRENPSVGIPQALTGALAAELPVNEIGLAAYNMGKAGLRSAGKALGTESGLLSNAWRLNPKAYQYNLPQNTMWRGLGKKGMEDAVASSVFRSKQNVIPEYYPGTKLQLNKSFGENPYFTPEFNTASIYGDRYIAEVPRDVANWRNRYGRGKTWSQVADRPIPIDQGRILQKDWWQGYKPIETPISSTIPSESIGANLSEIFAPFNPKNLKTQSGLNWIKSWYSDPDFIRRYSSNKNIIGGQVAESEQKFINTLLNEYQSKNYLDLLKDKGLNTYINKSINTGGVSWGVPKEIYVNRTMYAPFNKKGLESARTHELTHLIEHNGYLLDEVDKNALLKPFNYTTEKIFGQSLPPDKLLGKRKAYYLDPTEIHARMNQARFELGLSPKDVFTEKMFDKIKKNKNWFGMGKYIKDKKSFIDLMNNFWAVPPAAAGIGYVESQNQEPKIQAKGGKVTWQIID